MLLNVWSYDFYAMALSIEYQRRHMINGIIIGIGIHVNFFDNVFFFFFLSNKILPSKREL